MNSQSTHSEGTVAPMKGILWAIFASALWGVSGTILQLISNPKTGFSMPAPWFLSVRTLSSGVILLFLAAIMYRGAIFNVFRNGRVFLWLLAYGIFGLGANLLTFYISVQEGNAAASTILQYLAPIFIVIGSICFQRKRPLNSDLLVFGIALVGVFLAITQGDFSKLSISLSSLLWGIGSGITAAFYVVLPRPVLKDNPPIVVLGWGTLIAGLIFNADFIIRNHAPFWAAAPKLPNMSVFGINVALIAIAGVVLLGTVFPFLSLLHASKFATSEVVSLVDATQPVVTFILSIIFFSLHPKLMEIIGAGLVIIAIYLLQYFHRQPAGKN
ncbi:DMT family transporter [Lactobacillus sp. Sy-1]|uniref:DMT family transporter n=1 Tax=Lactobacillus sp. Sy-1 TaxID=2109645 RepID=UPI001C56D62B|nr:DMT family transporter [Lactobacillus sp. Sy-1]MBW1605187.1 DMT family transporter [Lactobacillus sp. Sy-1]